MLTSSNLTGLSRHTNRFGKDRPPSIGKESDNGKPWTGKIPKSGDYYIYVMAHPTAHSTLKVSLE